MNIERLQKLSDFLRNTKFAEDKFNLRVWGINPNGPSEFKLKHPDQSCGTAGCAVGWATCIFDELSLILFDKDKQMYDIFNSEANAYGWLAVDNFFDFFDMTASYLFDPDFYDSEKDPIAVADRIDYLIQIGEKDFVQDF